MSVSAYMGLKKTYDRLIDDILAGKPVWIVDSPELRERIRARLVRRKYGLSDYDATKDAEYMACWGWGR